VRRPPPRPDEGDELAGSFEINARGEMQIAIPRRANAAAKATKSWPPAGVIFQRDRTASARALGEFILEVRMKSRRRQQTCGAQGEVVNMTTTQNAFPSNDYPDSEA